MPASLARIGNTDGVAPLGPHSHGLGAVPACAGTASRHISIGWRLVLSRLAARPRRHVAIAGFCESRMIEGPIPVRAEQKATVEDSGVSVGRSESFALLSGLRP